MIDLALGFLHDQLNGHLTQLFGSDDLAPVSLSPVVGPNGEDAISSRLGMALIKVDEERVHRSQKRHRLVDDAVVYFTEPDLKLNLHVLIAAGRQLDTWEETLVSLSSAVTYFQSRRFFDSKEFPTLAPIDKLLVELQTLDFETQNHIWGALGAKYVPSVVYKVGVITIQREVVESTATPILTREIRSPQES